MPVRLSAALETKRPVPADNAARRIQAEALHHVWVGVGVIVWVGVGVIAWVGVGVIVLVGFGVIAWVGVTVTFTVVVLLELHPAMAAAVTAAAATIL